MTTGKHNANYYQDFQDLSSYPIGSSGWISFFNYIRRLNCIIKSKEL